MIYTSTQIQRQFSILLEKALKEGQIQFKTRNGQVFVIQPVRPVKQLTRSPFDILSVNLSVTTEQILESIRESRERYS